MRLRLVVEAVLVGRTAVHGVIATGDVNDRVIAIKRHRAVRHLPVIRLRVPSSLLARERRAMKSPHDRRRRAAMKLFRPMMLRLKGDRIEVRDAEASRAAMLPDRKSDLPGRLPLKKLARRDHYLFNRHPLVPTMDSHQAWMKNQSHAAVPHLLSGQRPPPESPHLPCGSLIQSVTKMCLLPTCSKNSWKMTTTTMVMRPLEQKPTRLKNRVTKIVAVPAAAAAAVVDAVVARKPKWPPMVLQNRITRTTTKKTCLASEAKTIRRLMKRRPLTRIPPVRMTRTTMRARRVEKSDAHVVVGVAVASARTTNPHRSLRPLVMSGLAKKTKKTKMRTMVKTLLLVTVAAGGQFVLLSLVSMRSRSLP